MSYTRKDTIRPSSRRKCASLSNSRLMANHTERSHNLPEKSQQHPPQRSRPGAILVPPVQGFAPVRPDNSQNPPAGGDSEPTVWPSTLNVMPVGNHSRRISRALQLANSTITDQLIVDPTCSHFVWTDYEGGWCWLKTVLPNVMPW
ncbi:hypothetical protein OUZ56_019107 [Daphnia magna]|uniref:Uncharacterized protein n=1 Tax=Daphnia magna TaxID=35525 RepID=A0ABQ9ZAP4_9CRUS|nr:hypothetical protein OUZ56_019107 [Daphnia magna]